MIVCHHFTPVVCLPNIPNSILVTAGSEDGSVSTPNENEGNAQKSDAESFLHMQLCGKILITNK